MDLPTSDKGGHTTSPSSSIHLLRVDPEHDEPFDHQLDRLRTLLHAPPKFFCEEQVPLLPRFKLLGSNTVLAAPLTDESAKVSIYIYIRLSTARLYFTSLFVPYLVSLQMLFSAGQPAPFGRGTATVFDDAVRKTHQLSPDAFEISME